MSVRASEWPAVFAPWQARLEDDLTRIYGGVPVRITPLAYHPRPFSHVVHLAISERVADASPVHAYAKLFKPKADVDEGRMRARVQHEYDMTVRVHDALTHHPGLATIRPLLCYPDALLIVTEEIRGTTLLARLERDARWFPSAATLTALERQLRAAGRWIAAFQQIPAPAAEPLTPASFSKYVAIRLDKLRRAFPSDHIAARRAEVLTHIERLARVVPPSSLTPVPVHGDFALANVMVDDAHVAVLDFAMAGSGTRLQDVTRLHLQLELLLAKPAFRRRTIARLQQALLQGFDADVQVSDPLFRLQTIIHRVNNYASLRLGRARPPVSWYNAHVARRHRAWLEQELRTPLPTGPTT